MPFGAIYGALFFVFVGFRLLLAFVAPGAGPFGATGPFLALCALAVAVGLLLLRTWARWIGVLLGAALFVLAVPLAGGANPVTGLLVATGSLAAVLLLALPATGNVRGSLEGRPAPAPRLGRWSAQLAAIGAIGAVAVIGWSAWRAGTESPAAASPVAPETTTPRRVEWANFGAGMERARSEGKPVLVNFVVDWCGYCRKMDRTTWRDPAVIDRLGDLVAVKVNAEQARPTGGPAGRDLAARYGVSTYPALVMLGPDGRELARRRGYQDSRELLRWLDGLAKRFGA
jgi:thiol:disulfide interchange protein